MPSQYRHQLGTKLDPTNYPLLVVTWKSGSFCFSIHRRSKSPLSDLCIDETSHAGLPLNVPSACTSQWIPCCAIRFLPCRVLPDSLSHCQSLSRRKLRLCVIIGLSPFNGDHVGGTVERRHVMGRAVQKLRHVAAI